MSRQFGQVNLRELLSTPWLVTHLFISAAHALVYTISIIHYSIHS